LKIEFVTQFYVFPVKFCQTDIVQLCPKLTNLSLLPSLLCPRSNTAVALSVDSRFLSFCLSLFLSRERKGVASCKLAGTKLITRLTRDPV